MLKFNKKIEYAILAMQYIALKPEKIVPAKEIARELNISFEFLSKTLQKLNKGGLIQSQKGIKGGYNFTRAPEEITISDVIYALEGNSSIVSCFQGPDDLGCDRVESCTIRQPMKKIQREINKILRKTTIAELADSSLETARIQKFN